MAYITFYSIPNSLKLKYAPGPGLLFLGRKIDLYFPIIVAYLGVLNWLLNIFKFPVKFSRLYWGPGVFSFFITNLLVFDKDQLLE